MGVAIFAAPSTGVADGTTFGSCACSRTIVSVGAEGIRAMRQVTLLLRSAPSRIGRRLALIAAIAAAGLAAAGV
jgi:hypothetical protein